LQIGEKLDARFEAVADAFMDGFSSGRDLGASVAVIIDGEVVVDLWHGFRDRSRQRPWTVDTLVCQFSVSKAMATICVLQAVDRGLISLDRPVADVWRGFAQHGKDQITVRQILSHRSGLIGFHQPMPPDLFYHWDRTVDALATETPWWEPDARHGYHARTFGFLLGEVLRRCSGTAMDQWFRSEVAGRCRADFHLGLSNSEISRCADVVPARMRPGESLPAGAADLMKRMSDRHTLTAVAFQNPTPALGYMNSDEFRRAVMPSANGHGTALATARILDRLCDLVSKETLAAATTTHSVGLDAVLNSHTRFGLGFMLHDENCPIGRRPDSFGHAGAGGSVAFHDPEIRLSLCFAMNQIQPGVITGGTSAAVIMDAVYQCL
jgi:CubicO group peptidase (beta-lactamase class C family)